MGLHQAAERHERVLSLFVLDEAILGSEFPSPNRLTFLGDCVADLDASLIPSGKRTRRGLMTASFLVKDLRIDWRLGARHFFDLLVDGDGRTRARLPRDGAVANNVGNWQWVAGTGVDTRPHRMFNPVAQAKRFDPEGEYVRRQVPQLGELRAPGIYEPWKASGGLPPLDYPERIVDHVDAVRRLRAGRA